MSTLYELAATYIELYDLLADGEIDDQTVTDTLDGMDFDGQFADKAEAYAKIIKMLEADANAAETEAKRLSERKAAFSANAKRVKDRLFGAMRLTGNEKIKTALFTIGIQKNAPSVMIDEDTKLPDEYVRVKYEPDKTAIKDALKAGAVIEGCRLVQGESLRIR
jgi:hypothetical protein